MNKLEKLFEDYGNGELNNCDLCKRLFNKEAGFGCYKCKTVKDAYQKMKELESQEAITLSVEEKIILSCIEEKYKWISRDKNGKLFIHDEKPYKSESINAWVVETRIYCEFPFKHLFQFIKWEDEEPYNIQNLLGGE